MRNFAVWPCFAWLFGSSAKLFDESHHQLALFGGGACEEHGEHGEEDGKDYEDEEADEGLGDEVAKEMAKGGGYGEYHQAGKDDLQGEVADGDGRDAGAEPHHVATEEELVGYDGDDEGKGVACQACHAVTRGDDHEVERLGVDDEAPYPTRGKDGGTEGFEAGIEDGLEDAGHGELYGVLRYLAQPEGHHLAGTEDEGDEDEQYHVGSQLGAGVYQTAVLLCLASGVGLSNLGREGLVDVHAEGEDGVAHLHGDVVDGIHGHAEGPVDDEHQSLVISYVEEISRVGGSGKTGYLACQGAVHLPAVARLGEMAATVEDVEQEDDGLDAHHEQSVEHQLVGGDLRQSVCSQARQGNLHDGDGCPHAHSLVGDDEGVVGDAEDVQHARHDGVLHDPSCCRHAARWHVDGIREHEVASHLHEQEHEGGHAQDEVERGGEHLTHIAAGFAHLEGDEALYGGGQSAGHHAEDADQTAHHTVNSHFLHAQGLEGEAGGKEVEHHREHHADVQRDGVAGYAPVVGGGGGCGRAR